ETFAERYPGRTADACASCHKDPHGGQFLRGDNQKQCVDCHDRLRFEPHAFTVQKHAETALPLTGSHLETACENCHDIAWEGRARLFRGTVQLCEGCHEDAHSGFFKRYDAELLKTPGGSCAACHEPTAFAEVADKNFEHGRWTGFHVKGAHAQGECEDCHPRATTPDENGRAFGRVVDHFGRFTGCETCHADPHRGGFDKPKHPRRLEGRAGCERCHVQASFRTLPHGFDHGRWTDFDLEHAHKAAACSACHARLRKPDKHNRTWAPAKGHRCADCHQDPHAGQFERRGITDCGKCHARATTFSDLLFRHDFDARFRLGEAHAEVACDACHKKSKIDGVSVVRYRPLRHECSDCHADQKDPLRKRRPRVNKEANR
ncbi:MAG: hypothetical protein V3T86_08740, partial [Planctomycetota bacterium]